jgi:hypothetical protein
LIFDFLPAVIEKIHSLTSSDDEKLNIINKVIKENKELMQLKTNIRQVFKPAIFKTAKSPWLKKV